MNWNHLQAFVWLRWRIMYNQARRAGAFNAVLTMIATFALLITAVPLFIGSFLLGQYAIPKAAPAHLMYVWDGLILGFLFFWSLGLLMELQRTESLSMSQFLHLPVSVKGAFLINYLGSLARLSLVLFGPMMLGFSLALVVVKGVSLLPVVPSLAAFVLMITALTYQFQGWLASLMSNPRRRRTVIVTATGVFVLILQLPNLVNFLSPWGFVQRKADGSAALVKEMEKLNRGFQAKEFDIGELVNRQKAATQKLEIATQQEDRETMRQIEQTARIANLALPIGWLPLGVLSAAEGHVLPSLLGLSGMTLIGTASLWRAYRATIRQYQGESSNREGKTAAAAVASPPRVRDGRVLLLEARIPGLSEPVAAIALGGLRALMRAPEAKMMLLTPLIMIPIFGSALLRGNSNLPESARPLVAIGAMACVLMCTLQWMCNQFGFDRDGFRVFVLSAAPRRDILMGKNLSFAPVALGMTAILLPIVQVVCPMRPDHLLSMLPQAISMFLMFCMLANLLSIYAPLHVVSGSLKSANPKLTTIFLQLLMVMVLFPLTQGATLLPLGIEVLLRFLGWSNRLPICLVLSLAECAVLVVIYRLAMVWQGGLLQAREQRILETVTNRAP